jgi:hypothetical protein
MVVCLGLPFLVFPQSIILKETQNEVLPIKASAGTMYKKLIACINEGLIYFMPESTDKPDRKGRYFYLTNISKKTSDSIILKHDKKTKSFLNQRILSLQVVQEKLIVVTDPQILIYTKNGKQFSFLKALKNIHFFSKILPLNQQTSLLYVNYNFHPLDSPHRHVWAKFNLTTLEIEQSTLMPENDALFTHFTNNWITTYKGIVAHARSSEYKIYFYDTNFQKTDSICSNRLDSTVTTIKSLKLEQYNTYSKEAITMMMKKDETSLDRIQRIFLLDSTHVLTVMKLKNRRKSQYDVWVKSNTKWELTKSEVSSNFYDVGKPYTLDNQPLNGFYENVNALLYDGKSNFQIIYFPYMKAIETSAYDEEKDYEAYQNEMVRKGELYFGLKHYTVEK